MRNRLSKFTSKLSLKRLLIAILIIIGLAFLLHDAHLAREAARNTRSKGLMPNEVYGEFWNDYKSEFPVGEMADERVMLVSYEKTGDWSRAASTDWRRWENVSAIGTFRVRRDLHVELEHSAQVVFEPRLHESPPPDVISHYHTLLQAGRNAVPYVIPYLASGDLLPGSYEPMLPKPTGFSRCHENIRTVSQLAAIVMSLLTDDELIVSRPAEGDTQRDAFIPLWLIASYDFDCNCSQLGYVGAIGPVPLGLDSGRVMYMGLMDDWKTESIEPQQLESQEGDDWVIVNARL